MYIIYTEVLTLTVPFIFPYILPVQWKHYRNAASGRKTACLPVLSCSHSSLPIDKENPSYHSSCVCLQVIFSRPLSFLRSVPAPLQIFSSLLQDAECSWEKPVVLLHSLSHSPEWELRALCSCGIWPLLGTTVFLDCLNLKHVTVWMTSSILYLLSPGCGLHSLKAFMEINALMKKGLQLIAWFTMRLRAAASGAEENCVPFDQIDNTAGVPLIAFSHRGWVLHIPLQAIWYLPRCWWILLFEIDFIWCQFRRKSAGKC